MCSGGMSCCCCCWDRWCEAAAPDELLLLLPLLAFVCMGSGPPAAEDDDGWCACQLLQMPEPGCAEVGVYVDGWRDPVALSWVYVGPVGDRFGLSSLYW